MNRTHDAYARLTTAAHAGAFGSNDTPAPSRAQLEAGNYPKGRDVVQGLRIVIEQPQGSIRTGTDASGKAWSSRMGAHYGYITGTKGADGDEVDVFVGPFPESDQVFVINQVDPAGGFDEQKVMLGFSDERHARGAYLNSFDPGWRGLGSIVQLTVFQLKRWLKTGNTRVPVSAASLPREESQSMTPKIIWDGAQPFNSTFDHVLYAIRQSDGPEGLLLDGVTVAEILEDCDGVLALDALVVQNAQVDRLAERLRLIMDRTGGEVKALSVQVTPPFKARGVTNIAVVFELSDGQTVSIFLHNPDTSPNKLAPTDEMISWKWLLNKKDITIVVAPERGEDLNPRMVAQRIMRLAQKNSAAFQKANAKRAERLGNIQALRERIEEKEGTLKKLMGDIEVERVERVERDARASSEDTFAAPIEVGSRVSVDANRVRSSFPKDKTGQISPAGLRMVATFEAIVDATGFRPYVTEVRGDDIEIASSNFGDGMKTLRIPRSAVTAVQVQDPVAVELTGNELGDFPDTPEGKKALRDAVKSHLKSLRGRWIRCGSIDKDIEIRKRGIKETLAFSGDTRKLKILAAIEQLIKSAKPVNPENFREDNNKPKSKESIAYYRMQASPALSGEVVPVEIIIEEDVNGLLHYDVLVPKTKTALDSAEVVALISQNNYSWIGVDAIISDDGQSGQGALDAVSGSMVLNLFIEGEEPEVVEPEQTPAQRVDAAYQFANATDAFKAAVAESVDQEAYSPFASAKAMDMKAKELGAEIHWGIGAALDSVANSSKYRFAAGERVKHAKTGEILTVTRQIRPGGYVFVDELTDAVAARDLLVKKDDGKFAALDGVEGWDGIEGGGVAMDDASDFAGKTIVGKVMKGGELKGRAVIMSSDGKAMVFVGESTEQRVQFWSSFTNQMESPMWSEDGGSRMIGWLLKPQVAQPASTVAKAKVISYSGASYEPSGLTEADSMNAWNAALEASAGDMAAAAKDVYKTRLQGTYVETNKGDVLLTGQGWREMKTKLEGDRLRCKTIPYIPHLLKSAQGVDEPLTKARADYAGFIKFDGVVTVADGTKVHAVAKVGIKPGGQLMYFLRATDDVLDGVNDEGGGLPQVKSPLSTPYESSGFPVALDPNIANEADDVNLVILEAWDKDGNPLDVHTGMPVAATPEPVEIFAFKDVSPEALALLKIGAQNNAPRSTYKTAVSVQASADAHGMAIRWEAVDSLPAFDDVMGGLFGDGDQGYICGHLTLNGAAMARVFVREDGMAAFDYDKAMAEALGNHFDKFEDDYSGWTESWSDIMRELKKASAKSNGYGQRNPKDVFVEELKKRGWDDEGTGVFIHKTLGNVAVELEDVGSGDHTATLRAWRGGSWVKVPDEATGSARDVFNVYDSFSEDDVIFVVSELTESADQLQEWLVQNPEPMSNEGQAGKIKEAAAYLKDFVFSLGSLAGMTDLAQVILSTPLGKSGRDSLLMAAFGITRLEAHDINNGLDARKPHKLLEVDMQEAFTIFPGLREMVDSAIAEATPMPPNPVGDHKAEDREFLMSVIDGSAPDILEPELATKIEAAYTRNSADAEMVSLFGQAVNAYTQAMLNATAGV